MTPSAPEGKATIEDERRWTPGAPGPTEGAASTAPTTAPTRLGHETSVTVIEVGEKLRDRFQPGQRLAIQPDIYVNGRSTAYGYTIPGGLIQYHVIGREVLAADDGAYVVPVDDRMGYAETALTEPWACVEASYTQRRRLQPLSGGPPWGRARPDDD